MKYLSYIFTFIGLILLAGAYFSYSTVQRSITEYRLTKGTIIDFVPKTKKNEAGGNTGMAPVVLFRADGDTITHTSNIFANPPAFELGQEVELYYDEKDPSNALINDFMQLYLLPLVLAIIGGSFSIIGLVMSQVIKK